MSTPTEELPLDCSDIVDANVVCLWRDDSNQEHALYFNKDKEYTYFNKKNRHWIALIKRGGASSCQETGKPENRSFSVHVEARAAFNEYVIPGEGLSYRVPPDLLPDKYSDQNVYSQQRDRDGKIYIQRIRR